MPARSCRLPLTAGLAAPPPAGRYRTAPQLYIKGVTPAPARLLEERGQRNLVMAWVVLIKLGQAPTVIAVPTPNDQHPHSVWLGKGKDPNSRELTGPIYKKIIKDVTLGPGNLRDGTLRRQRHPIKLVHDREPAHTSAVFQSFATTYNISAVLLPPRSPDLNPLDYGVFGAAQKKLDAEMERRPMSFTQQCAFLEGAIKQADTDAVIAALHQRIKRCIAAGGGHFE